MSPDSTTLKRCTKCGELKPRDQFSRQSRSRDGLQPRCKACNALYRTQNSDRIREKKRQYYANNRETEREKNHNNYIKNRESRNAYGRQYHAKNREIDNSRWREYYAENSEHIKKYNRQYRVEKPDVGRAAHLRRRARLRSLPSLLTTSDIALAFNAFNHCCAACGQQLNGLFHRDHLDHWIPLASSDCPGTVPHNMVPLCSTCNNSKKARDPEEWVTTTFGKRKGRAILRKIEAFLDGRKPDNEQNT